MKNKFHFLLILAVMACTLRLSAQTNSSVTPNGSALGAACVPATRENPANWMSRHEKFVAQAKRGGIDILFMGDSITDNWRSKGSNVWNEYYTPRNAANFGIGGDRTQHVLWRIENGELDNIHPKVTVLMIGTNNSKSDSANDIARAISMIIDEIHSKIPDTTH
jgi:lysophospholipase L1-like esterase